MVIGFGVYYVRQAIVMRTLGPVIQTSIEPRQFLVLDEERKFVIPLFISP